MKNTNFGDDMNLYSELYENKQKIKDVFTGADDIVMREFDNFGVKCLIVFADNVVSRTVIENPVLTNIMVLGEAQPNIEAVATKLVSVGET